MSQRPYDPFDSFGKPSTEKLVKALERGDTAYEASMGRAPGPQGPGWTEQALVPPPSRKDIEEAQTQKPFDPRQLLDELLEIATSSHYVMADAIIALDRLTTPQLADAMRSWRTKLQEKCEEIRSASGPKVHVLKADPGPFRAVWAGIKKYEVRKFDRDYRVGDELKLVEFDRGAARYSGAKIRAKVTAITKPGEWGLPDNVGVLGIEVLEKAEV